MNPKLTAYKEWLVDSGYSERIVKRYSQSASSYSKWLNTQKVTLKKAQYSDLIGYIGYLHQLSKTKIIINEYLRGIGKYYEFLELPNLAYKVVIRGVTKKQLLFLDQKELQNIYDSYSGYIYNSYTTHSNKLILGFMIYQAVAKHDLQLIKLQDVDLEKGTLYVPSGNKFFNGRTLKLEAHQIIPLHNYISNHRGKGTRGISSQSELLFTPQADKFSRVDDQCKRMHKDLKKITQNTKVSYHNLSQLRQSRISLWIKQYGMRQAQYLSGRKNILSMERYKQMDLQNLSKQIELFHPLK